jgi:hypothetical protein
LESSAQKQVWYDTVMPGEIPVDVIDVKPEAVKPVDNSKE